MGIKPKYPKLYDEEWWIENRDKTDVEIANDLGCASSTVQSARRKMGVKPLSNSETARRQWSSLEFRKENSRYPKLYSDSFWKENKHRTDSEISEEFNCAPQTVRTAREFMGYKPLSKSEAQKRRFERDGLPEREEIPEKLRKRVLKRANYQCEVPGCNVNRNIEIHHLERNSKSINKLIALCFSHHIWLERSDKNPKNYKESKRLLENMFPKT